MTLELTQAAYIDSDEKLQELVNQIRQEPLIAVDTESNNLYAYHSRVCLIQLSTRTDDYIIDPFVINDMQPLGEVLHDEHIEKIFHAAEYDLITIKRDFGFEVRNLFDTMFAARLCGAEQFGLGDLLRQKFGVEVDKSHQLDDWGKRPLSMASLRYAQMDTHYLPALRDQLLEQLRQADGLEEAAEVFADVLRIDIKEKQFDPDGYWKIGRPSSLTRRQMAILKELYALREEIAQEENVPPFKVFSNNTLVNLARELPTNYTNLNNVRGINHRQSRMYGDRILTALEHGRASRLPNPPEPDNPDPIIAERYIALHAWRKEMAIRRNIDSSLILAKQTLWELARLMPKTEAELAQIEGIGQWRLAQYGADLLKLIAGIR